MFLGKFRAVNWRAVHPIQQHTGHPLQTLRQAGDALDGPSDSAEDNEQNLIDHLTLLELPLNFLQSILIVGPGLQRGQVGDLETLKLGLKVFLAARRLPVEITGFYTSFLWPLPLLFQVKGEESLLVFSCAKLIFDS